MSHTLSSAINKVAAYFGFAVTKVPDIREAIFIDPQDLDEFPHLRCPHCGALDNFADIDRSVRRNALSDLDYGLDGRSDDWFLSVHEDDHNYVDDRIECNDCGGHVILPPSVDLSWG